MHYIKKINNLNKYQNQNAFELFNKYKKLLVYKIN